MSRLLFIAFIWKIPSLQPALQHAGIQTERNHEQLFLVFTTTNSQIMLHVTSHESFFHFVQLTQWTNDQQMPIISIFRQANPK